MLVTLSIFSTTGYILLFLLVLTVVICIHELGHFLFAKRAGILCHEFSFGMGPKLWSKKYGETVFSIRAIPFGGYVSMAGEEMEADVIEIGKKIRLGFDEANEVNRIILNPSNINYHDFLEVTIEKIDLYSEEGNRLYINEYTVKRNAMYVFDKKQIQIAPKDRRFTYKSKTQRFLTTIGGPLMNLILAFVVYLGIAFSFGVPDWSSTVVSGVAENMPATSVVMPGDKILSVNGVDVDSWSEDGTTLASQLNSSLSYVFVVERDGQEVTLSPISPNLYFYGLGFSISSVNNDLIIDNILFKKVDFPLMAGDKIMSIDGESMNTVSDLVTFASNYTEGSHAKSPTTIVIQRDGTEYTYQYVAYGEKVLKAMGAQPVESKVGIAGSSKFSFFGSFGSAASSFVNAGTTVYGTLGVLIASDQVHLSDLSGFVGIYSITESAAAAGLLSLLSWVGLLSVNLGVVNLLPLPALDGGRIAFIGYELVSRKRPSQKFENSLHTVMFFLLIALMIYVTYYDILRMIGLK